MSVIPDLRALVLPAALIFTTFCGFVSVPAEGADAVQTAGAADPARAAASTARAPRAGDIPLTEGLAIKLPEDIRSRTGMSLDAVEAAIVTGKWAPPKAGTKTAFLGGTDGTWKPVKADDRGWFDGDDLNGGYVYFSVKVPKRQVFVLEGGGHDLVFVNGTPRVGNQYGSKDTWESWEPHFDYSLIPVLLEAGRNDLLFRCYRGHLKATLRRPVSDALLNARDTTLPDLIVGQADAKRPAYGAIVVINASPETLEGAAISVKVEGGGSETVPVPSIPTLGVRKVGFPIAAPAPAKKGERSVSLQLQKTVNGRTLVLDTASIRLRVVGPRDAYKKTFISAIDGSVQYYAVNPARGFGAGQGESGDRRADRPPEESRPALILSLHGAAVEAINQATSYVSKTWAHIVAPTNRRPYGYNWEDWGRLDALEALEDALGSLDVDRDRVYLTGHSMGGHGTWVIGATYPDRFAAIGPSAGWLSFWSYRSSRTPGGDTSIGRLLKRATSPSDTLALAGNLRDLGVYILHGSDDDNVPVTEARRMVERLGGFHRDFVYHEQKGAGHWWDVSDEPGTDCVDWPAMFDFFARHARPGAARTRQVDFATANPGISSSRAWLSIEAQIRQLDFSTASVRVDPELMRFTGTTANVARLALATSVLERPGPWTVGLDGGTIPGIAPGGDGVIRLERRGDAWAVAGPPSAALKGPHRYGTLKDAFRHRAVLVYGTKGTAGENAWALARARYDAEKFWYQGNGAFDVVPDTAFDPAAEPDRSVVLYGNAATNAAWKALLADSPVQVDGVGVRVGDRLLAGNDLACLFIQPRRGSDIASVAAITGTGIAGMRLTNSKLYLEPGYPFPDCLVFSVSKAARDGEGLLAAGFFGLDWTVGAGEFVWSGE